MLPPRDLGFFCVPRLFTFVANVRGGKFTRDVFAIWLDAA